MCVFHVGWREGERERDRHSQNDQLRDQSMLDGEMKALWSGREGYSLELRSWRLAERESNGFKKSLTTKSRPWIRL